MMSDKLEISDFIQGGEGYLITGANGFIGSSIASYLLEFNKKSIENPCKIMIVVRNYDKAVKKYGEILNSKNIKLIICDNKEKLDISEKIDWIICAAAVTKKKSFRQYPVDTLNDNVLGIYNCLELAKDKKVKGLLFISSVQVYGGINENDILEDSFGALDSMKEEAIYPESKRMGETLCWAYSKQYSVPVKCARLFHVYGEGEEYNNGTFLSDFFNDVISDRDIVIKGGGEEVRNLCYISDVVRGILYILKKGKSGEAYNIGSEINNYTIKEIAELLCRAARPYRRNIKVIIENVSKNESLINKQIPNLEKLKDLGWKEEQGNLEYNFEKILKVLLDK